MGCYAKPGCPMGGSWWEVENKCFKFIGKRMTLTDATSACTESGGTLFAPSDGTEISQLEELARNKEKLKKLSSHL